MDFKDIDLANLMRILAESADTNVVLAGGIEGVVTVRFVKVRFEEALCSVARGQKLTVTRDGDIYYLARPQ